MLVRLAISAHPGVLLLDRQHLEAVNGHAGSASGASARESEIPLAPDLGARRREGERGAILQALQDHHGVVRDAARQPGISRQALYKAMRRVGLSTGSDERPCLRRFQPGSQSRVAG